MNYYPLFLDIRHRPVLVIGGGNVALEKIVNLLKAGAKITVLAPKIIPSIRRFNRRVTLIEREFEPEDLDTKYILIFCATEDSVLNAQISMGCRDLRILCNTVDDPQWCHFIVPAILRRGALTVAISTSGVSPTLAKQIKDQLRQSLDVTYTQLTRWLKKFRPILMARVTTLEKRKTFWSFFYAQDPIQIIRKNDVETLEKKAKTWL